MAIRHLSDLPASPRDKVGWPWTIESEPIPELLPNGDIWPKISIVTPSYNQGHFIEETIRSVLMQGYPNLEYIVMDGGRKDNTLNILRKYEDLPPPLLRINVQTDGMNSGGVVVLTVFSIPKSFVGHIGIIQRNALASWTRLGEGVQVILFGDDAGVAEVAREAGVEHVPDIERTEYGTPLVNSAFSLAARMARNPLLCYANADIMFTDDLPRAAASIRRRKFLMVGHRWNVDILEPWDFSDPSWRKKLVSFAYHRGSLSRDDWIDYFVLPCDSKLTVLPPFAVGRPRWDNYLLFRCRQLGYPLIDATGVVTAVHQNHDYGHVPKGTGNLWYGLEADANIKLLGDELRMFRLIDATHKLTEAGLKKTTDLQYSQRRHLVYLVLHPRQKLLVKAFLAVKAILRRIGLTRFAGLMAVWGRHKVWRG